MKIKKMLSDIYYSDKALHRSQGFVAACALWILLMKLFEKFN